MKLKKDFIIHESADGDVLLAVGEEAERFHGIVKLNETAGFIVRQLEQDVTLENLVQALHKEYPDVLESTLENDIKEIIDQLDSIHAIER